jgi:transcriptional regulator with XRE-family HTH domain
VVETLATGHICAIAHSFNGGFAMGRKPGSDKQSSDQRKQEIIRLVKKGETGASIARQLGLSRQYVNQVLDDAQTSGEVEGIDLESVDVSKPIFRILELSGLSVTSLARILGLPRESVSRWASATQKASAEYARRIEMLAGALEQAASKTKSNY